MPSFNVWSGCFQVSLNLRAVSTVWISINFVTQLFLRPLCRGNIWKSTFCCFFHLVDGGYTDWTPWTSCGKSCEGGTRVRNRFCTKPPPSNNGQPCSGASYQKENCNTQPCPGESPCFKGFFNFGSALLSVKTSMPSQRSATSASSANQWLNNLNNQDWIFSQ